MRTDPLTAAVHDNARWCHAMCAAHGRPGVFAPDAWTNPRRSPPLYPDAVTLDPSATTALLDRIERGKPGCSVKDSFATLDLAPSGFRILFEATWILRPAGTGAVPTGVAAWSAVRDAAGLATWETAWRGDDGSPAGLFTPALLDDPAVTLLAGTAEGRVVAGAVAHRSAAEGEPVVGISNVFSRAGVPADDAWTGSVAAIGERFAGLPIVGYEAGPTLAVAQRHGFRSIGPLRVWVDAGEP